MRNNNHFYNTQSNFEHENVKEIDLKNLFFIIKRRIWILLVFATITTFLGYYYDANNKPSNLYESSTRILLNAESGIENLKIIMTDSLVMESVISELKLEKSAEALAGQIKVEHIGGQILEISVIDINPENAANIANKLVEAFTQQAETIMNFTGVNHYQKAKVNNFPINAGESSNMMLNGLIAGIVLGIGLIFLVNAFDNTLITEQEVSNALGIQVLGSVSKINKRNSNKRNNSHQLLKIRGESVDS
ncbi:Wzz/FepE/Etk N-terminal domain-containing protein [Bacillus sp. JJ1566]|uniref:YveK family protein n=1 Tax=Bacillus sp. JJ1566 TaxID=3122961 RepID=UPI002FFE21A7